MTMVMMAVCILSYFTDRLNHLKLLTCNRFSKLVSVFVVVLCFAAFQNCFWAEYRFIGHILIRQSRNFSGGSFKSPAPGQTTTRSSTKLYKKKKKNNITSEPITTRAGNTYPRVLRKPEMLPSEYRETMSPRWRKLTDPIVPSPIFTALLFFTWTHKHDTNTHTRRW